MHLSKKLNNVTFDYYIGNAKLEGTVREKYLDVYVTDNLSWKAHVESVVGQCSKKLGMIRRLFSHCSSDAKIKLYNHLVRCKIDYCSTVWKPPQIGLQRSIERVQKRAAKVVTGARVDNYPSVINQLGWNTLHCRTDCNRLIMCYKILNGLVGIPSDQYFENRPENNHRLRTSHDKQIKLKFARTDICKSSFFYNVVPLWNSLPAFVVQQPSLATFKSKLLTWYHSRSSVCDETCIVCREL